MLEITDDIARQDQSLLSEMISNFSLGHAMLTTTALVLSVIGSIGFLILAGVVYQKVKGLVKSLSLLPLVGVIASPIGTMLYIAHFTTSPSEEQRLAEKNQAIAETAEIYPDIEFLEHRGESLHSISDTRASSIINEPRGSYEVRDIAFTDNDELYTDARLIVEPSDDSGVSHTVTLEYISEEDSDWQTYEPAE